MDERRIYFLTCAFVERVQEEMRITLSVEEWETIVKEICSNVKSLISTRPSPHSASTDSGKP